MVESGFLIITSYDRQIEYVRRYGETVIVAGSETVVWDGKMPNAGKTEHQRFTGIWINQNGILARGCSPRQHHALTTVVPGVTLRASTEAKILTPLPSGRHLRAD